MTKSNESLVKSISTLAPLFISCVLLAVQWGSVTTTMEVFERSLNKVIDSVEKTDLRTATAIEKTNAALVKLQNDMAYIRGELKSGGK